MEPWKADFFGCCMHIPASLCAFMCPLGPCCLHLSAATAAMNSCMTPYCMIFYCGIFGHAFNRERIRLYYNIQGECCLDCIVWCCCPCCASVQEFRETGLRREAQNKLSALVFVPVNVSQPPVNYSQPGDYNPNAGYTPQAGYPVAPPGYMSVQNPNYPQNPASPPGIMNSGRVE